jgi:hypothetical protein
MGSFTTSFLVKELLVGHHIFFNIVLNGISTVDLVAIRVEVLMRIVVSVNAFNFFGMIVFLATASPGTRFDAKHEWHANDNKNDKEKCEILLSIEEVDVLSTHFQEVVNHNRDDGRAVSKGKHWATVHVSSATYFGWFTSAR